MDPLSTDRTRTLQGLCREIKEKFDNRYHPHFDREKVCCKACGTTVIWVSQSITVVESGDCNALSGEEGAFELPFCPQCEDADIGTMPMLRVRECGLYTKNKGKNLAQLLHEALQWIIQDGKDKAPAC